MANLNLNLNTCSGSLLVYTVCIQLTLIRSTYGLGKVHRSVPKSSKAALRRASSEKVSERKDGWRNRTVRIYIYIRYGSTTVRGARAKLNLERMISGRTILNSDIR